MLFMLRLLVQMRLQVLHSFLQVFFGVLAMLDGKEPVCCRTVKVYASVRTLRELLKRPSAQTGLHTTDLRYQEDLAAA